MFISYSKFGRSIEPIDGIDDFVVMNSRDRWIVLSGKVEAQVEPKGRSMRNNLLGNSSIHLFNYFDLEPSRTEQNETFHFQSERDKKISKSNWIDPIIATGFRFPIIFSSNEQISQ